MAIINRHGPVPSDQPSPSVSIDDQEKANASVVRSDNEYGMNDQPSDSSTTHLHRGLRARQVTMIALGGALGSGLLIGTGVSTTFLTMTVSSTVLTSQVCSRDSWTSVHLHLLHHPWLHRLDRPVRPGRDGRMASTRIRLYGLCSSFL